MTKISEIIKKLKNNKKISVNEWKIIIFPVFKKIGVDSRNIDIIISKKEMELYGISSKKYSGYSYLKSLNPSLKKDLVLINSDESISSIIRTVGHEVGHIVTKKGSREEFGQLTAEKQAFNIENKFSKEFDNLYDIKSIITGQSKYKIYRKALEETSFARPVIKEEFRL